MLAYVFWHRPAEDVDREDYERRLRAFHATLDVPSACFRLHLLPWRHEDGYEDWYLVADWTALGDLNAAALAPVRRVEHDAAAEASAAGWGGVYRLVRGLPAPPAAVRWTTAAEADAITVWQRQMVLGPAPEFCLAGGEAPHGRERVA
jgi:hypothetical protein